MIVATGATARQLGLPGERALQGRGVSYCAVCDAAFFRDRRVVVVGGGDSAMEEATLPGQVRHRGRRRAPPQRVPRLEDHAGLRPRQPEDPLPDALVVEEVLGADEGKVTGVRAARRRDRRGAGPAEADGFFVAIGHDPNTALFEDRLDMDDAGYLIVQPRPRRTNVEGVFAAGDVSTTSTARRSPPPASGCMSALDAERWLSPASARQPPERRH